MVGWKALPPASHCPLSSPLAPLLSPLRQRGEKGGSQVSVFVIEVSTPGPRDARGRLGGGPPLPRILFSALSLPCEMGKYFTGPAFALPEGTR
jgi:hypothetical protein